MKVGCGRILVGDKEWGTLNCGDPNGKYTCSNLRFEKKTWVAYNYWLCNKCKHGEK